MTTERLFTLCFFGIWPYIALTVFVVGHIWRWRTDQLGWGTATSQILERKWLMVGSPLFHGGMLLVLGGHAVGLLVPASLTETLGISESLYHSFSSILGSVAGLALFAGLVILCARRFLLKTRLRLVTTEIDKLMYAVLAGVVIFGLLPTIQLNLFGNGYDYRETLAVWWRSIFYFHPHWELMVQAPMLYQIHAGLAFLLFALWPFTRLVHVWSAPLSYLIRPPLVYRHNQNRQTSNASAQHPPTHIEPIHAGQVQKRKHVHRKPKKEVIAQ
jgi:nitrate reductase gamma subunit